MVGTLNPRDPFSHIQVPASWRPCEAWIRVAMDM